MRRSLPIAALFATLAVFLLATPAEAVCNKSCRQAKAYCERWEDEHPGKVCGTVRGAVCTGKSWRKIKQVNAWWSACELVKGEVDRQEAVDRCRQYEENTGKNCEVHSPRCKAGWVKLGSYGNFRACRRIEPTGSLLYDSYKAFMRKWEGSAGTPMPEHFRLFVEDHYDFRADRVRFGEVRNTHAACTTDCYDIYCNVAIRGDFESGTGTGLIFHELAHVEQCEKKGGRKPYALMWFGNLPAGFFRAPGSDVKDEFKERVHDEMPMEKQAENKGQSVLRKYKDGLYNRKWKCRLYQDGKAILVSDPTHRTLCERPSDPFYKKAQAKVAEMRAKNVGGYFEYTFGNKKHDHVVLWDKRLVRRATLKLPGKDR